MIFEFPALQGKYGVGITTEYIRDESRQEPHNPIEKRELMTTIWYPADVDKKSLVRYQQDEIEPSKAALRKKGISEQDISNLDTVYSHAILDALPTTNTSFPVVLFSHGYLGTKPNDYTGFCEELASHGFVVVAIAHTYYTSEVTFPDGRQIVPPADKYSQDLMSNFKKDQEIWIGDVECVLHHLDIINADQQSKFFNLLDMNRIGMFGHSFGGLISLHMVQKDSRIKAGLNFDQLPYDEDINLIEKPCMFIMAQTTVDVIKALNSSDEELAKAAECDVQTIKEQIRQSKKDWDYMEKNYKKLLASNHVPFVLIPNIKHAAFSDYLILKELPLYKNNKHIINLEAMVGNANGFETMQDINKHIVQFFMKNL